MVPGGVSDGGFVMSRKRRLLITLTVLVIVVGYAYALSRAFASDTSPSGNGTLPPVLSVELAEGFNLIGIPPGYGTTTVGFAEGFLGGGGTLPPVGIEDGPIGGIYGWNAGQFWDVWSVYAPEAGVFDMEGGRGYFIWCRDAVVWEVWE